MIASSLPKSPHINNSTPVSWHGGVLRRKCACGQHTGNGGECEACKKKRLGTLQRAAITHTSEGEVPSIVYDVLHSPGHPLDSGTRAVMEPRLGHDFSHARVHTDERAAESAQSVNALAYTVGSDIVFGTGQFSPNTRMGQQLLAHELTHVKQQTQTPASENLKIGPTNDAFEQQAEQAASNLHAEPAIRTSNAVVQRPLVQRQPVVQPQGLGLGFGFSSPVTSGINFPVENFEISASEAISAANPTIKQIAQKFKDLQAANPDAYIQLSAYLTEGAQNSSEREKAERRTLSQRMSEVRDVLKSLGVPSDQVSLSPATAYSTSAKGQVSVEVFKSRGTVPSYGMPPPTPGKPSPQPGKSGPSLSDLLTLKFGPVTIDLPKSVAVKLPIPITSAKKLVIDLKAEVPGDFSFSITLDGLRYVRVGLKAGVGYDKDKGFKGSAGLQVELTDAICHAANPTELKEKITKAGEKLTKAMNEFMAESDGEKRMTKVPDIASALGEMYEAVDKSKASCKKVPKAKFEFGYKGPLGGDESDPNKRETPYIGGTITIPF